jgi:hypothetical protein
MARAGMVASLVVLIVISSLRAQGKEQIQEMRQALKMLRTQKASTIKGIRAQFESLIRQEKRTEAELKKVREQIAKEEKELIGAATTEGDRTAIKERYDLVRRTLSGEVKLDAKQIAELRSAEKSNVSQVSALYAAKIKELEAKIKSLESQAKTRKK